MLDAHIIINVESASSTQHLETIVQYSYRFMYLIVHVQPNPLPLLSGRFLLMSLLAETLEDRKQEEISSK